MRAVTMVAAVAGAAGLAACTPEPEVSGRADFAALCAPCHGPGATGGGPAAAGLSKVPPDLTLIAARHGGQFDYAMVMSRIDGYTRSDPGQVMPDFGVLLEGDTVLVDLGDGRLTPTPARLFGIAQYLASIQATGG
jgi:mono/diheme cytochrome c family protein